MRSRFIAASQNWPLRASSVGSLRTHFAIQVDRRMLPDLSPVNKAWYALIAWLSRAVR